jgi:hypothetical protein
MLIFLPIILLKRASTKKQDGCANRRFGCKAQLAFQGYTMMELTPTQIRGLKLAKEGKLFPQPSKKWTHLNAEVTYARTDRFKERPQKIKFLTTTTLTELREMGLIERCNQEEAPEQDPHEITMAGKIWLMRNK